MREARGNATFDSMSRRVPYDQTQRARALRNNPTTHERKLWDILRLWNNELDENPGGVFQAIVNRAAECLGGTHPQPLPSREGRERRWQ